MEAEAGEKVEVSVASELEVLPDLVVFVEGLRDLIRNHPEDSL